jgi:hypothetical protein
MARVKGMARGRRMIKAAGRCELRKAITTYNADLNVENAVKEGSNQRFWNLDRMISAA